MEGKKKKIKDLFTDIFYSKKTENALSAYEKNKAYSDVVDLSYEKGIIVSLLITLFQIIFIIVDSINNFYHINVDKGGYLNLLAQIVLLFFSLLYIIIAITKGKYFSQKTKENIIFYYYIIIIIGMFCFIGTDSIRITGYSISIFYLLAMALVPHPNIIKNIIHFILVLLGLLIVLIISYKITGNIVITSQYFAAVALCFFCSYFFQITSLRQIVLNNRNEELKQKLLIQSSTDSLTNALNRYALTTNYSINKEKWIIDKETVGIIMFDIDHFKSYNDTYSHIAGDECLNRVVASVIQLCNEHMEHVYRYGGEEFILFTNGLTEYEMLQACLDIKKAVEALQINRDDIPTYHHVTISVGCVKLDVTESLELNDAILLVDKQLYNAKDKLKNCVSFNNRIYR